MINAHESILQVRLDIFLEFYSRLRVEVCQQNRVAELKRTCDEL